MLLPYGASIPGPVGTPNKFAFGPGGKPSSFGALTEMVRLGQALKYALVASLKDKDSGFPLGDLRRAILDTRSRMASSGGVLAKNERSLYWFVSVATYLHRSFGVLA